MSSLLYCLGDFFVFLPPLILVFLSVGEHHSFRVQFLSHCASVQWQRPGSFPRRRGHWQFPERPCQCYHSWYCEQFLSRLIALSMTFRYPSFCRIVLGSLPSVKVNQVRETRTGLLGFACVQRGRIPSVGGWTPFHSHLLFSSPSFLPSASSVTKQFCISNMGPGGSSFSSSFPFL